MSKSCFVICPISSEDSDIRKRSDILLKHIIKPVCEELEYEVIRVDQIQNNDKIDQTIIKYLNESDLVIADLTDHNPNVFYELGYRSSLKKHVIQVALDGTNIPFDIATIRTLTYATNDLDKAEKTREQLKSTIKSIEEQIQTITSLTESNSVDNKSIVSTEVITMLYDIKSSIDALYQLTKDNNNNLLKEVMATSYDAVKNTQNQQTPETILLQEAIRNPGSLVQFFKAFGMDPKDLMKK